MTSDYDLLAWAGHHSGAKLFGVFAVSGLHNLLHLAFGVAGLLMARTYAAARAYLLVGGLVYLGLWVYGLLIDHASTANFVPVNGADNWLHLLGLGAAMVLFGVTLAATRDPTKEKREESDPGLPTMRVSPIVVGHRGRGRRYPVTGTGAGLWSSASGG